MKSFKKFINESIMDNVDRQEVIRFVKDTVDRYIRTGHKTSAPSLFGLEDELAEDLRKAFPGTGISDQYNGDLTRARAGTPKDLINNFFGDYETLKRFMDYIESVEPVFNMPAWGTRGT